MNGFNADQAMKWRRWQVDLLLVLITLIWGGTFLVVQNSLKLTGPFMFVALRFGIGALALALIFQGRLRRLTRSELLTGSLIGLFLFGGYAFQTVGLQHTTTSKAGFITGLNVVIVPLLSILVLRQWPALGAAIGVALATVGMALLSLGANFNLEIGPGELLVLGCAFCFAWHIVAISRFAPGRDAINLTIVQIATTSLLSLLCAPLAGESLAIPPAPALLSALFMGVVATAFTLAVMNRVQQFTTSTRAALIYALEPVFAGLFGYLAGEMMSVYAWIGCGLIFLGMISGELRLRRPARAEPPAEPEDDEERLAVA